MSRIKAGRGSRTDGQGRFSSIESANIQRSSFNRSHGLSSTINGGDLIPIWCDEGLPGDTVSLSVETFVRMATPLHPLLSSQTLDLFFFAVPNRLLMADWKRMMGEQEDPDSSTDFRVPVMTSNGSVGHLNESLSDYMGIPTKIPGLEHSAMWHRAYALTWNEHFRDQNLQDSTPFSTTAGPDDPTDYPILKRGRRHDYFTSCLPWPQKGDAVELSLGGTIPIDPDGTAPTMAQSGGTPSTIWGNDLAVGAYFPDKDSGDLGPFGFINSGLEGDLSAATAVTVNEIREAITLQQLLERDARGGTRYVEQIKSHFGVTSKDARQQRPEYLGGASVPIGVNPVVQTGGPQGAADRQLGDLAAYVVGGGRAKGFVHSCTEHVTFIGLACIRADIVYQQGLARQFSRRDKYDYYWPTLANLGEQPVLNKELWAQGTGDLVEDAATFGYQEAWADYRYKPSYVTGKMRSNDTVSLDTWHLALDFDALPLLNDEFIQEDAPLERVIAVVTEPEWIFDAQFSVNHVRPMPTRSTPGLRRF